MDQISSYNFVNDNQQEYNKGQMPTYTESLVINKKERKKERGKESEGAIDRSIDRTNERTNERTFYELHRLFTLLLKQQRYDLISVVSICWLRKVKGYSRVTLIKGHAVLHK